MELLNPVAADIQQCSCDRLNSELQIGTNRPQIVVDPQQENNGGGRQ